MDLVAKVETVDEKLSQPTFWGKLPGLTFQELQPEKFEESLELIKNYLIPEEVLCVGLHLEEDPEGCENLLRNAWECMRDGTSIVVLHQDEDGEDGAGADQVVVGVMVARVVQRVEHMRSFSRIKIAQGGSYQKWRALCCYLQKKADLFEAFQVDKYYRIYHIVVHPDHRDKGVASFLLRLAAERLTRLFTRGRPGAVCTAVAPSRAAHRLLTREGFKQLVVLPYHEWLDDAGRQIVENVGAGNYKIVLFVHQAGTPPLDGEEDEDEPVDISPLVNPTEDDAPEPEPPVEFPGRALGSRPPPPADCRQLPGRQAPAKRSQSSTYSPYPLTDMMDLISSVATGGEQRYSDDTSFVDGSPMSSGPPSSSPKSRVSH